MFTYNYTARDGSSGKSIKSKVEANSQQAAINLVKNQGYTVTAIEVSDDGIGIFSKYLNRVRTRDRVIYSRQLSTLINAGLPLVQSLRSVTSQTKSKRLKVVSASIIADVEGGTTFSAALGKYPEIFNQVFTSLVAAGEVSGTLDTALERVANQQEKDAEIISKVRGALVYPLVVLAVMFGVVTFMIVAVLPQVKQLYSGIGGGVELPIVTRMLLALSDFTIKYWWVMIIVIILLIFAGSKWARTLGGKRVVDTLKMRTPAIGGLFMKMYMARFSRTGTTLVASGVPLLQMLAITSKAINNVHIEESITRASEQVKGGKSLSSVLINDKNFLELVPQMIKIGEDSGAIEDMMDKTADYYEKEVDEQIKTISTIIEPALMVILGLVAVTIIVAILLPIYSLVGKDVVN